MAYMGNSKAKRYFKSVLENIIKVTFVSIILTLVILISESVYYLGFLKGYNESQEKTDEYFASSLVITPIPSIVPSSTPKPQQITPQKTTYGLNVSWGGPDLWQVVNKKRQEYGVNPLSIREELCTIASIRLNELLELGKLDGHEGFTNMTQRRSDLKWIFDKYGALAEFLAVGGKTPQETVSLWENTMGHRQLLSGGEYVWGCIYSQNTFAVAIAAY
ncbi:MAG TPA: CAP domain-containing protein [Patescibacteria group bacterium]|nr:CAP domain-containing protein [Patescibacteria group bacterium]